MFSIGNLFVAPFKLLQWCSSAVNVDEAISPGHKAFEALINERSHECGYAIMVS